MFLSIMLLSAVISYLTYIMLKPFLYERVLTKNWRGRPVAGASGLIIMISLLFTIAIYILQAAARPGGGSVASGLVVFLMMIFVVGLLGFIDDILGDRRDSGFRGHFRRLKEGKLTSGALKAIGGFSVAIIVAGVYSNTILILILNALLLALSINSFNLLDLRPGRSIKIFLLAALAIFIASYRDPIWILWAFALPPILVLLWADLTEQSMLGDTGSNIIGAIIGYTLMLVLNWPVKLVILILMALFHYYTEKHSLTELVMRIRILRKFDELGTRRR